MTAVVKTNPSILLAIWLGGIAGVRLSLAIHHPTFMGIDGGAYLLGMFQYWGDGPAQPGIMRPPLAPGFLLVPTVWVFGVTPLAFNLYAVGGSMLIFPFYYLLARRVLGPAWAALAVVALSLDWQQWTLFVTGVVPVLGFGGICFALWAMMGIADGRYPSRYGLVLVVAIPLIAYSNQTSAGLALVSLTAAWLALPRKRGVGMFLFMGGLLAIAVAYPWYHAVLPGSDKVAAPGPLFYLPPAYQWQWYQALMIAGAITLAMTRFKGVTAYPMGLRAIVALVVAHTALSLVWSNDEAIMNILFRGAIWVTVPFWIVLVWLVAQWRAPQRQVVGIIACGTILAAVGAGWIYQNQFQYSSHISEDVLAAVDSLDLNDVTRIGSNGESRAYWLSAITGKPVVWVQSARPSPAYAEAERQARCELGWLDNCATGYVSHWIIDKTIRQQVPASIDAAPNPEAPWSNLGEDAPWLEMVWIKGEAEVWKYAGVTVQTSEESQGGHNLADHQELQTTANPR